MKLTRQAKTTLVDTFELTDSASRNILISNVKQMFEKGTIRTLAAAEALIKLIQEDKMKEFDERIGKLDKAENTKAAKRKAEEIAKDSNYTIQHKETSKHVVRLKTQTANYQHSSCNSKRNTQPLKLHGKTG